MSSFVVFRKQPDTEGALRQYIGQRAVYSETLDISSRPGFQLFLWSALRPETCALHKEPTGGFAAVAGTFLYGDSEGREALELFYKQFDPTAIDLSGTNGHFALVIEKAGHCFVLNDRLGVWKLYGSQDGSFISAGFLETLLCAPSLSFHAQGLYEYVFNGHALGTNTPFQEVMAAMPGKGFELTAELAIQNIQHSVPLGRCPQDDPLSDLETAAKGQVVAFKRIMKKYSGCVGKISSSLSGWFFIREQGARPVCLRARY
ncbi:hypothetical protein [Kordiimonas pumila]|uniref:Glutamine amidotransferase type-2 domain-containing protein n=1 Tax=Kordiimonas pumila TaxID=2161677 RepID=A0ABV7DA27_9PROT|nr:hypothetical protein [Kordiimonas pumila]